MHRQQTRLASLTGLISIALGCSGFALAHGASGGHGSAGHGLGSHGSSSGHRSGHHGRGWHGGRGSGVAWYRGGNPWGRGVQGHGFFVGSLPSYCRLVYWDGVAYYYADDVYYEWNGTAGAYEVVHPPAGLADKVDAQAPIATEQFVFPNENQTNEQLERDREACHRWAVQQVGFDPKTAARRTKALDPSAVKRANYFRADGACLEARNYSVEPK